MPRKSKGLFNDADLKSVELSGYSAGRATAADYQFMQQPLVPTGAVYVDDSVQFPVTGRQPNENQQTERFHLPSITQTNQQQYHSGAHSAHLPNSPLSYQGSEESSRLSQYVPHDHQHSAHVSHTEPISHTHTHTHQQHEESGQHQHQHQHPHTHTHTHTHQQHEKSAQHQHHQHKHKHNHQHQHNHPEKIIETYDPRWWYLPVDSVHSPKSWRAPEYRYVPPKWYESPRTYGKILKTAQELGLPPRKYFDCQCQICKPANRRQQGVKYVVHETRLPHH